MIVNVNERNIDAAARIHAESWQESHKSFCSAEFVAKHTVSAQAEYLRREMAAGKRIYMLIAEYPVGIVSIRGSLIENLYVLPGEQNKGYGTRLLKFAMEQCQGVPTLWILNNNQGAQHLYTRHGFAETGNRKQLREDLYELELAWSRLNEIRQAEKASHEEAYTTHALFETGSWLAKPVKTVLELLPLFEGREDVRALDLGCGVGRNSIPVAQAIPGSRVDCVDILPMAIEKLRENARRYGVAAEVQGIVSSIDTFEIQPDTYDLILAISALEHVDGAETFCQKLTELRDGTRPGGVVCLVVNTAVREQDKATGRPLPPQFEVDLSRDALKALLEQTFGGWTVIKQTVVHQKYDIPRDSGMAVLETDVLTFAAKKEA